MALFPKATIREHAMSLLPVLVKQYKESKMEVWKMGGKPLNYFLTTDEIKDLVGEAWALAEAFYLSESR